MFIVQTARVFYRAGFIENWGQGIQKICDECQNLGAEFSVYELKGTTLRISFKALERALIDDSKTPNRHGGGIDGGLAEKIIELIREDDTVTVSAMAESLRIPKRTIEREMKKLRDSTVIKREGGNRYGHWTIIKQED